MRRLKPDPIPDATLKQIVGAGIRAPSGGNVQEWAFLLVRDPETKTFIRDRYWQTWERISSQASFALSELPPSQQRMMKAAAELAANLDAVPVPGLPPNLDSSICR